MIFIVAAGFVVCVTGCGSSGGNAGGGGVPSGAGGSPSGAGGSPSSSPSCSTSGFVHPLTTRSPALAAALVPMPVIPDPDIILDDPRPVDPGKQEDWASTGIENAHSNPEAPPGESVPENPENLQQEADAVAEREEVALWTDDLNSDPATFGEKVCEQIQQLKESGENLDNLGQVLSYLQQQSSNNPAAAPLAGLIKDANQEYQQAFGPCGQNLEVTQWLLDTLNRLFCLNVPSG